MRTVRLIPILLLLGVPACTDVMEPTMEEDPLLSTSAAVKSGMNFEIGVLAWAEFDRMWFPDGRLHADGTLVGPVSGDLEGEAELFLRARLDEKAWAEDKKVGVANGTLTIFTDDGEWEGNVTGTFIGEQLFSTVVLHGPAGRIFRGRCDETTPVSEILACSGDLLNPFG